MAVQFTVLGSGSSGNCAYLETDSTRVLIDAGLSGRQIRQRLLSIGRTPENLDGILITHEHTDHTQGLKGLAKLKTPVFCNRLTRDVIEKQNGTTFPFQLFETGAAFDVGDLEIETFSVPHDAYDPVGFLIKSSTVHIGILTDLGQATRMVLDRVRSAHVLLLETNHDLKLLQEDTKRPWSTKQRIMSRHGHLSNDAAAQAACDIVSADLEHLFLAHLSSDCNTPDLAESTVRGELEKIGATHVRVKAAVQKEVMPTLSV